MENSSKALLIAVAVLIVILLIVVSIKIFNSPKDVQQQATDVGMSISREVGDATEDISSSFEINREFISGEVSGNPSDETQGSDSTTNWNIENVDELKQFADLVNSGNNFEGITVYLDANLDLNNENWTPIGNNETQFCGVFDGQGHSIKGIKVEVENYAGLFGYTTNVIKNLTVEDSNIKANKACAGAIAATCKYINSCKSINNTIIGFYNVGGIVGYSFQESVISSCYNNSIVENKVTDEEKIKNGYGQDTAGIVGWISNKTEIIGCVNEGNIYGSAERVGGIVGGAAPSVSITRCVNKGTIELGYNKYAYDNSSNDNTGGIVGLLSWSSAHASEANIVSYCYNEGKVIGQKATGGIVGCTAQFNTIIEKCYNTGYIEGKTSTGGISGKLARGSNIYNSYNIGKVTGEETNVGGITGYTYYDKGEVRNCYNKGEITGNNKGEIIGNNTASSTIINCPTDENEIKNTFINNANTEGTIWEIKSGINNGYPVIVGMN